MQLLFKSHLYPLVYDIARLNANFFKISKSSYQTKMRFCKTLKKFQFRLILWNCPHKFIISCKCLGSRSIRRAQQTRHPGSLRPVRRGRFKEWGSDYRRDRRFLGWIRLPWQPRQSVQGVLWWR